MHEDNLWDKNYISDKSIETMVTIKKVIAEMNILDDEFKDIFSMDVGVSEKYTLFEHTMMVLKQFDRYFANSALPDGTTENFFRYLLVLHDLGKPIAAKKGDVSLQHKETLKLVVPILKKVKFTDFEINLAKILLSCDPLGRYLRYGELDNGMRIIKKMTNLSGLSKKAFFSILLIYFMCDAGAYTSDAGGVPSLDHVFSFDHENRELMFSEESQTKMNKIIGIVFN